MIKNIFRKIEKNFFFQILVAHTCSCACMDATLLFDGWHILKNVLFFSYDLYSISGIVMYLVVYNFRLPNGNFENNLA